MRTGRPLAVGALLALALAGVVGGIACSSSRAGSTPCNEAPWQCGSGQTCWPNCVCSSQQNCTAQNCTPQFSCMASDNAVPEGQNCDLVIGKPQCGDNQTCVELVDAGSGNGVCRQYCDQHGGCPSGESCVELTVGNATSSSATERVCVPPPLDTDASFDIDAGGGSSGSSSGGYNPDAWYEAGPFDGSSEGGRPQQ